MVMTRRREEAEKRRGSGALSANEVYDEVSVSERLISPLIDAVPQTAGKYRIKTRLRRALSVNLTLLRRVK